MKRYLLPEEPYRSYGITSDEFFSSGSLRMEVDVGWVASRLWGEAAERKLRALMWEAISSHPGAYASGVAWSMWDLLWRIRLWVSGAQQQSRARTSPQPGVSVVSGPRSSGLGSALLGIALRRPRRMLLALALPAAALLVLLLTSPGFYAVSEYVVPVVPAFILVAAAGLVRERDHVHEQVDPVRLALA